MIKLVLVDICFSCSLFSVLGYIKRNTQYNEDRNCDELYITDTLILAIKTYFCLKTVKNQSRYGNCASTWQNRFVQLVHVWLPFQNQRWGWKPNNDNNLKRTETCMWLETSQHIELYWHLTTSHQGLYISNRYWNCHALDWKVKDKWKVTWHDHLLPVTYLESASTAWITVVANVYTTEVQNHKCLVWCAPITYP